MNTEKIYTAIVAWLVNAGPRILFAIVIFALGQWFISLIKKATSKGLARHRFASNLRPFAESFVFTALQVLLVIAIMNILGIQMSIFAALIAAVGVAAGLALSGTLQNFTSGILILVLKPFHVGDNIVAQGQEGTVTSIQLFYTIINTYDNKAIIIPNSKLSNELIINITKTGSRRLDIMLNLPFSIPFTQVRALAENITQQYDKALSSPPLRIGVSDLRGDGYTVTINLWLPAHGFHDESLRYREVLLNALIASGWKLPGL